MQILDTTLRDGGNAVGQQFTGDDISRIVAGLAASGIPFIEVGHGVSVGLSARHAPARVPDQTALALARRAAGAAKIGVIAVPVLTSPEALEPLYDDLDFLRLAVARGETEAARSFIRAAQQRGKMVFVQMVKSHVYDGPGLVETVRPLASEGVHGVYVVDTAGCMDPGDVTRAVAALKAAFPLQIGFHGHNNWSYALANSLAAVAAGADLVDATLGGIGRGAGNLQLELFAAQQQRNGACRGIDLDLLFELSADLWGRYPGVARGLDPVEIWYALQGWDSLSRADVLAVAQECKLSVFALIREAARLASGFLIRQEDIKAAAEALARPGPIGSPIASGSGSGIAAAPDASPAPPTGRPPAR